MRRCLSETRAIAKGPRSGRNSKAMKPISSLPGGTIAVLSLLSGPAMGQSLAPPTVDEKTWHFSITPYLFLPVSTTGTSTVAGQDVDLDLNLMDVLKVLNGAISGRAEAWNGDFGLAVEGYFVALGDDTSIGLPGPGTGHVDVEVRVRQAYVDLLGGYRVLEGTYDEAGRRYAIEGFAGARYNSLTQDVDVNGNADLGPGLDFQRSLGGTEDWWEPVIGARGLVQISERWTGAVLADFGGFGVNDDDLQWKVRAGVDYRPWVQTSIRFGWQFYGISYATNRSDGKFVYDVFQTGPYLAFTYQFQ